MIETSYLPAAPKSYDWSEIEVPSGAVVTFVVVVGRTSKIVALGIDQGGQQADSYPIVPASSVASGVAAPPSGWSGHETEEGQPMPPDSDKPDTPRRDPQTDTTTTTTTTTTETTTSTTTTTTTTTSVDRGG